jgi:hypothetical protein
MEKKSLFPGIAGEQGDVLQTSEKFCISQVVKLGSHVDRNIMEPVKIDISDDSLHDCQCS